MSKGQVIVPAPGDLLPTVDHRLALIAAVARNGVIGHRGGLPWKLSEDLRRFQRITRGHSMIMGRKTFESIGSQPLPDRPTVVISRRSDWEPEGVLVASSIQAALILAEDRREVYCAGGADVYRLALPLAARLLITWVETDEVPGDTFFPEVDWDRWRLVEEERVTADERNDYDTTFCRYQLKA